MKLSIPQLSWVLFIAVLAIFPVAVGFQTYILHIVILIFSWCIVSSSWNLLSMAGQTSFCHGAFFGLGAYASAIAYLWWGIYIPLGELLGGCLAAAVGFVLGVICLRSRGVYLAVATLAFAGIALRIFTIQPYPLGPQGIILKGLVVHKPTFYYIALAMMLSVIFVIYKLVKSRYGLVFSAMRQDEDAAEARGINTLKYRLIALTLSAFFAGVAGGFYAHYFLYVDPSGVLGLDLTTLALVYPIVGGIQTIPGPLIGTFVLLPLTEYLRITMGAAGIHLVVYGLILALVMIILPKGLLGLAKKAIQAFKELE